MKNSSMTFMSACWMRRRRSWRKAQTKFRRSKVSWDFKNQLFAKNALNQDPLNRLWGGPVASPSHGAMGRKCTNMLRQRSLQNPFLGQKGWAKVLQKLQESQVLFLSTCQFQVHRHLRRCRSISWTSLSWKTQIQPLHLQIHPQLGRTTAWSSSRTSTSGM